ncbi:spinster family MFS transporter [Brevundimonas sp.]|uniref:spinster family MFS transporter n=1 Tax=Brevundimonas sp. TaxID=1871086 RepID=UPI003D6D5E6A
MSDPLSSPAEKPSITPRQANFALGVFLLAYILSFVDRQILSLLVDPIKRDLGVSDLQMGLLQGFAFALLYAFLGVPVGLLADRTVRKRIIAYGVVFWSAATALCGFAGNYALLFAARMGVGVGEATLSPSAHSFLSDAFEPAKLARAMAIYTMGITLGGGMAYLIGGTVVAAVANADTTHLPLIGAMRPWQMAFLIVAAPGVLVAALVAMVKEPARRSLVGAAETASRPGLKAVTRYVGGQWRAFVPIYMTSSVLGILGYSLASWFPTLLIRNHDLAPGTAGLYMGAIYLALGSAGSICGGLLSEHLARRDRPEANLLTVGLVSAALIVPAILAPLAGPLWATLALLCVLTFLANSFFGSSIAALQLATPNTMRATNSALFLLVNNLIGLSLGAAAVPVINAVLFAGSENVGPAIALIAAACCPLSAALAFWGLKPYRRLIMRKHQP